MRTHFLKRRLPAVLILIFAIAAIFAIAFLPSEEKPRAYTVDDNYYFDRVDVQITVNRDKTFDIQERLGVVFHESRLNTGIIRDIQRLSKTTRIIDGKKKSGRKYFAYISDVKVSLDGGEAKVTQGLYGDFYSVKMQTPNGGYISKGKHEFLLNYKYDMSDDKASGYDDFTFDVLGYAMAYTKEFSAKIIFPEGTPLSDVTFRTNGKKAWSPDYAFSEYARVEGNEISVFAKPEDAGRGYTVQVILPDGYFSQKLTFYPYYIIFAVLALLGIVAVIALIAVNRANLKILSPVEYTPPSDMTIMQISAVWHKGARYKDVGAVVLQWAAKGLVSIKLDGKRNLKIIPDKSLKSFEDERLLSLPLAEKKLFDAFMLDAGKYSEFSTREFRERKSVFKKVVYKACDELVSKADKSKPVRVKKKAVVRIVSFMSLIPTLAVMLYFGVLCGAWVCLLFLIFMVAGTFIGAEFYEQRFLLMLSFPMFFYVFLYGVTVYLSVPLYDYAYLYVISPVWWAVCVFVLTHFVKGIRGKKRKKDYRKLYGFYGFLALTELDRLKVVLDENPDLFSEVLPYCYVFGIGEKVKKRFAALGVSVPPYLGDGASMEHIGRCISHSCHDSSISLMGSGGSGGGSSGGGGGGGSSGGGGGGGGSRGC